MQILFVSPEFIDTFWSWKYLLKFVSKHVKAAFPPLGLLTVAAMLPKCWGKKLVDLNVSKLSDEDILCADYVFVGAMNTQEKSVVEVIARCKKLGKKVILGGPILHAGCEKFPDVSHFFIGESEETIPEFLKDLENGRLKRIYSPEKFPDMDNSPIPLWELVNPKNYASGIIQGNRGCPFKCTFCNIASINGRKPRSKSPTQFLQELDVIYNRGFRGPIFVADDNFIGNKKRARELLVQIIKWQKNHCYSFDFTTEVDITLSDNEGIMDLMVLGGFKKVFLGIETPNEDSLRECDKTQNEKRNIVACVKRIQNHGLHPMSGFIIGFDNDSPSTIFDQHSMFYEKAGIVFPMVGILQAIPGTFLYEKLRKEGRLLASPSGNNTDCFPNFIPKMPVEILSQGYKNLMKKIYSPREYYKRICVFLQEYKTANRIRG